MERARNRVLSGYLEVHHVIPRCMGGSDERVNLVQLTAEEHFVAHQLLCRMHPSVIGLSVCMIRMAGSGGRNRRLYGWLRRRAALALSKLHKGRVKSEQERKNISEAGKRRKPRVFSEQARVNMAAARRKTWEERRANGTDKVIAAKVVDIRRRNGTYRFSDEWKRKIGEANRNRTWKSSIPGMGS